MMAGFTARPRVRVVAGTAQDRARLSIRGDDGVLVWPPGDPGLPGPDGVSARAWRVTGHITATSELDALASGLSARDQGQAWAHLPGPGEPGHGDIYRWSGRRFVRIRHGFTRPGRPGPAVRFTTSAETLAPDGQASVQLSGDGAERHLHFAAPRGYDGDKGPDGPINAPLHKRADWDGPPPSPNDTLIHTGGGWRGSPVAQIFGAGGMWNMRPPDMRIDEGFRNFPDNPVLGEIEIEEQPVPFRMRCTGYLELRRSSLRTSGIFQAARHARVTFAVLHSGVKIGAGVWTESADNIDPKRAVCEIWPSTSEKVTPGGAHARFPAGVGGVVQLVVEEVWRSATSWNYTWRINGGHIVIDRTSA